jgi:Protein of unknown function (DUF3558)
MMSTGANARPAVRCIGIQVALVLSLAACGGTGSAKTPGAVGGGTGGGGTPAAGVPSSPGSATGQPPAGGSIDACSLLSDAEVEQVTGLKPASEEDGDPTGVLGAGCTWKLAPEGEIVVPELALGIAATGGKSYYEKYFKPYATEAVSGLGDSAIRDDSTSLMALKGDVLVSVQFVGGAVDEIPRKAIELVFSKLP